MGALEMRNKKVRCPKCLEIKRMIILPDYPSSLIEVMCNCNKTVESLSDYCKEIKKKIDFNIICTKCQRSDIKNPRFCYDCQSIYCSKCFSNHSNDDSEKNENKHRIINVEKFDFHCVDHQSEIFMGFCQQCLINICPICIKEKKHEFHQVDLYTSIIPDKKQRENIRKGLKKSEEKIESNHKIGKRILKKNKKTDKYSEIETLLKINEETNKNILSLLKYFYTLYENSKHKNYSMIHNLITNTQFNLKIFKAPKKITEKDTENFIKYLKNNFILIRRNKETKEPILENSDDEISEEEEDEKENEINIRRSSTFDENLISQTVPTESSEITLDTDLTPTYKEPENNIKNSRISKNREHGNSLVSKSPDPIKVVKNVKIPDIFTKKEEKPIRNNGPRAKLNMPSIFEKKEEKPKERAQIIKTGADPSMMNDKKDLLKQMLGNKGMQKGGNLGKEEVVSIVHENNEEGGAEEVLNKFTNIQKKKKKPKKKFMTEEGNVVNENPYPEEEKKEENLGNEEGNNNVINENVENNQVNENNEVCDNGENNDNGEV